MAVEDVITRQGKLYSLDDELRICRRHHKRLMVGIAIVVILVNVTFKGNVLIQADIQLHGIRHLPHGGHGLPTLQS